MDEWQQMATKTMWHDATFVLHCPRHPYPQHMHSHIPSIPKMSARGLLWRSTATPIPSALQTSTRGLRRRHMHTRTPSVPENTCTHISLPFPKRARGVFLNNPHPTLIPSASLFYHPPRSHHSTVNDQAALIPNQRRLHPSSAYYPTPSIVYSAAASIESRRPRHSIVLIPTTTSKLLHYTIPPTKANTRTRSAAYLTTAAIPPSDIRPLLLLQVPTNLALITAFLICTYRDRAIPHTHASGRGMVLA